MPIPARTRRGAPLPLVTLRAAGALPSRARVHRILPVPVHSLLAQARSAATAARPLVGPVRP